MAAGASRPKAEDQQGKESVADETRPELFDATQYDFERLEIVVTELVDAHRILQQENAALRTELRARTERSQALESEVEDLRKRRERTHERLGALIAEIDGLDGALAPGTDSSAKKAAPSAKPRAGRARSRA
ncbi:MAG: cell division protein ZapB [Myxococcota bacterium]|jgi:chromosome segregation ATPase|nr:cell division protein ZapB [Myxococcota bacterium]